MWRRRVRGNRYFFTSKFLVLADAPFSEMSTLYCPAGHAPFFEMWNSVVAGPVGVMLFDAVSITVSLVPCTNDHLADRVPVAAPSVFTAA